MQLLAFLALAAGFFALYFGLSIFFFNDVSTVLTEKNATFSTKLVAEFKLAQLTASIVSFVFPALLFGYYSSPNALPYIGLQKKVSPVLLAAAFLLLFTIIPFIGWLGEINAHVKLGSMQKSLLEMEAQYNRIMTIFLQMKSPGDLFVNLFIMALLPAIAEELFFRGALQKVLLRLSHQPWIAILVSSLVFALLHGTFFKFIPIFTIGLLLGTVYYITRNIWYTIIIHFLNNAVAVLAIYFAPDNEFLRKFAYDNIPVPVYGALISFAVGIGIIFFIKRKSDEVFPEIITNDDNEFFA